MMLAASLLNCETIYMTKRDTVLARVDALPVLPTIPEGAKALGLSAFQMRGLIAAGLVKTTPVGRYQRPTRKSLRELAEQYG
jgi:hypothetical protein